MNLSVDSEAIICLTSSFKTNSGPRYLPLSNIELNRLISALDEAGFGPGALLDKTPSEIEQLAGLSPLHATRIRELLNRVDDLNNELTRFERLGIWALALTDHSYPKRLLARLKNAAPPVIFGSGEAGCLSLPGVAVVGSRAATDKINTRTQEVARRVVESGLAVFSGGATGVDLAAMTTAFAIGGRTIGVLADSLVNALGSREAERVGTGRWTIVSQYWPDRRFTAAGALSRNKLIYALSDYAIVIASQFERGGTWQGTIQALSGGWVPVFVSGGEDACDGNRALLKKGCYELPDALPEGSLVDWLRETSGNTKAFEQYNLF